jgi:diguanylate cyclase (GGDEF)-like protein
MLPSQPPKVLILAQDAQAAGRWAEILQATGAAVWQSAAAVPNDAQIEVLLTDLPADEAARESRLQLGDSQGAKWGARLAVVGMGAAAWADVALGPDWTSRELCLACGLVGEIVRLSIARDEIAIAQQQIKHLAETDPLTGLANRRAWDRQLSSKFALARAARQPQWLAIVDLDHFKQVNDQADYATGDQVLQSCARALAEQLRREDLIARLGGDEFGVLLADIGEAHVRDVLERLREAVAAQQILAGTGPLTASIGFAASQQHGLASDMFAGAERALREAKRSGGNRIFREGSEPE